MSASKHQTYWHLQLAAHFMQKQADRDLLKNADITTAQFGVLAVIANGEDVTQKDVATALGFNQSAITAMVKRLMQLDLVVRRDSPTDGRAKVLSLTEKGRAVQKNTRPPFRKINERIESVMDQTEIDNLADYLERLTTAFR